MQLSIWRATLSDWFPQLDKITACLTAEERNQGNRLIRPLHQQRFLLSHAILRWILSRYLEQSPDTISFEKGAHGKPYVEGRSIQFNMTHSNDLALYAISAEMEVGIDVEYIEHPRRSDALVKRFFSKQEHEEYQGFPEDERGLAFYRAWTRKEAYLKATGLGLSYPLDRFDVSLAPAGDHCLLHVEDQNEVIRDWTLFSRQFEKNYLYSIAIKAPVDKLLTYTWNF